MHRWASHPLPEPGWGAGGILLPGAGRLWILAAQGGCGFSFSGDTQAPPGQGPLQPAVGDPAWAGGLDWMTHRGPCQPLPFCDSILHPCARFHPPARKEHGACTRAGSVCRSRHGARLKRHPDACFPPRGRKYLVIKVTKTPRPTALLHAGLRRARAAGAAGAGQRGCAGPGRRQELPPTPAILWQENTIFLLGYGLRAAGLRPRSRRCLGWWEVSWGRRCRR